MNGFIASSSIGFRGALSQSGEHQAPAHDRRVVDGAALLRRTKLGWVRVHHQVGVDISRFGCRPWWSSLRTSRSSWRSLRSACAWRERKPGPWQHQHQATYMMGNDWLATVRLSWDQPSAPPLGSFGAEADAESAYGLRDVTYATQQQNQR